MQQLGTPILFVGIDVSLVTGLLQEQHPDLAHLPIHLVDAGWDNAIFRLGEDLSIRLPRRQVAAKLIENEQTWLPKISEILKSTCFIPFLWILTISAKSLDIMTKILVNKK
jgi:aminoglycoside phosphotransferase (APT) family kinase protein